MSVCMYIYMYIQMYIHTHKIHTHKSVEIHYVCGACIHSYMHIAARKSRFRKRVPSKGWAECRAWLINPLLFRGCVLDIGALHSGTTKRLERC